MRRTPLLCFIAALLFGIAALNEGNLNHWGATIVLAVVAIVIAAAGVWSLRASPER